MTSGNVATARGGNERTEIVTTETAVTETIGTVSVERGRSANVGSAKSERGGSVNTVGGTAMGTGRGRIGSSSNVIASATAAMSKPKTFALYVTHG